MRQKNKKTTQTFRAVPIMVCLKITARIDWWKTYRILPLSTCLFSHCSIPLKAQALFPSLTLYPSVQVHFPLFRQVINFGFGLGSESRIDWDLNFFFVTSASVCLFPSACPADTDPDPGPNPTFLTKNWTLMFSNFCWLIHISLEIL